MRARRDPERILDGWDGFRDNVDPDAIVTAGMVAQDAADRWLAVLSRGRPSRKAAVDALDALHAELVAAVRVLLEPIGQTYAGDPSSVGLSRWLLRNVRPVALSPAGPDVVTGMARVHRRALAIIDNAPERVLYGFCAVEMDDGLPCDEPVAVPKGARLWTCPGCRTDYDADELDGMRRERALEQNLTVAQLAEVVGRSRHAIVGLLRRRGIAPVGHAIEAGKSVALYPARSVIEATRPESA